MIARVIIQIVIGGLWLLMLDIQVQVLVTSWLLVGDVQVQVLVADGCPIVVSVRHPSAGIDDLLITDRRRPSADIGDILLLMYIQVNVLVTHCC